jgi:hypothetical protein
MLDGLPSPPIDFTFWSIRLAMLAYVASLALRATQRTEPIRRALWSVACLLTWAHVGFAFAVHHHWSHAEAYAHTARQTLEKVGIDWGGGIYFNYLFLVVWSLDALWWHLWPASYRTRATSLSIGVHAYLAFIAFNATVVFADGAGAISAATP